MEQCKKCNDLKQYEVAHISVKNNLNLISGNITEGMRLVIDLVDFLDSVLKELKKHEHPSS